MVERQFKVIADTGIHARPATVLVQAASNFNAEIKLQYKERTVNLKSLMGVMSLGISHGTEFTIWADGSDEQDAINKLEEMLTNEGLAQ